MLSNWTKATTTTTGTGTLTLSAVSGRPLPSAAHVVDEYVQYSINTSDGKFEAGIGKIAATNTLVRTRVTTTYDGSTYNNTSASALTLASGTHSVYVTPIAAGSFSAMPFPNTSATSPAVCSSTISTTQANVGAAASQRATAWPFRLETSGLLTAMGVRIGATGASSTTLLGLYEVASDGTPGRLIAKTSATIDSSTGSGTWKTQSVVANVYVTPGWYYAALCVTAGTNPTFTGGTMSHSAVGMTAGSAIGAIREDATATDLADPFPRTTLVWQSGNTMQSPCIGLILS